jgi:hypothetical protein
MKMLKSYRLLIVAIAMLFVATGASAQNMLANPGFEDGWTGWEHFENAYVETWNPEWCIAPFEGDFLCKMYGNFWGSFNVSVIFQEFAAAPGTEFTMECMAKQCTIDPMLGGGAPDACWAVMKIAYFGADGEIGGDEVTICDGTGAFPLDTWYTNGVVGVVPEGATKIQALILYLQPAGNYDPGAVHVDNVSLQMTGGPVGTEESTWGAIKKASE